MKILTIKGPITIYTPKDINFAEGSMLSLVYTFRKKGMVLWDSTIAEYYGCSASYINQIFSKLNSKGYVRIEKPGSKYRRIFLSEKADILLNTIVLGGKEPTSHHSCSTSHHSVGYSLSISNNKTKDASLACGDDKHSFSKFPQNPPPVSAMTHECTVEEANRIFEAIENDR